MTKTEFKKIDKLLSKFGKEKAVEFKKDYGKKASEEEYLDWRVDNIEEPVVEIVEAAFLEKYKSLGGHVKGIT